MKSEFDCLFDLKMNEYKTLYAAKVKVVNGNTYVTFGIKDCITEQLMKSIHKLLDLMCEKYSLHQFETDQHGESILETIIDGDDLARATYIRSFINNGYKIKW